MGFLVKQFTKLGAFKNYLSVMDDFCHVECRRCHSEWHLTLSCLFAGGAKLAFDTSKGFNLSKKEVLSRGLLSRLQRRHHPDCLNPCFNYYLQRKHHLVCLRPYLFVCKWGITMSIFILAFSFVKEAPPYLPSSMRHHFHIFSRMHDTIFFSTM